MLLTALPAAAQTATTAIGAYPTYTLSIDAAANGYVIGPGIDCGAGRSDCIEVFAEPTTISLSAVANPGYVFLGWAGLDCVGVETIAVDVNRAKVCRPVFNASPDGAGIEVPNYAANAAFLDIPFGSWDVTPPGGRSQLVFAPPYGQLVLQIATSNTVVFRIAHPALTDTTVRINAASSQDLAPALYEPTTGSPFPSPHPSIQLTYNGTLCASDGGRFRVYEIAFAGPTLSAFSADFEVACPNGGTVTGSIRYNAARASLLPFDGVYPSSTVSLTVTLGGYVTSTAGVDCGDGGRTDCEEAFEPPSVASLRAIPSPGYEFLGWGGICSGADPNLTMTVRTSGRCFAVFYPVEDEPSHPLGENFLFIDRFGPTPSRSVWLPPEGVSAGASGSFVGATASGISDTTSQSVTFGLRAGRIVPGDYDAVPAWDVDPYVFDRRPARITVSGCSVTRGFFRVYEAAYDVDGRLVGFAADFEAYCSGNPSYVAGAVRYRASRDIVLPFGGAYPVVRLSVAPSPYGRVVAPGIICDSSAGDCAENYHFPVVYPIQAIPNPGYSFAGWTGDCSGGSYTQVVVDRTTWCDPLFRAGRVESRPTFTRFDFTGDEYADLVWQNSRDGRLLVWRLSGTTHDFNEPPSLSQLNSIDWQIVASADANSDGYTDLYWQHQTTGGLAIWFMRGIEVLSTEMMTPGWLSDPRWRIRTVFDLDRDGHPDLIWQHPVTGHVAVWYMDGGTLRSSDSLGPGQIADPRWTIVGAADADADGRTDLYWQHPATGELAIWYMDGVQLVRSGLLTPSIVSTNWWVRGVADFNRDGSPDIIWQNVATSEVAVWIMRGSRLVETRFVHGPTMWAGEWILVGPR